MRDRQTRSRALPAAAAALMLVAACSSAATTAPSAAPGNAATAAPTAAAQSGVSDKAKQVTFPWGEFKLSQRIIDKAAAGEPLNIIINIFGTAKPVFGAMERLGMERACERNQAGPVPINCRMTGPASSDFAGQVAELESLLASNQVDCLSLNQGNPDLFSSIIDKYVAAGIPVMTNTGDAPNSKRFSYFGISELETATRAGTITANLVKDKGLSIDTIAGGSGGPTELWAQDRYQGFIEGYKTVFPDAKFFNDEKSLLPVGSPDYTVAQAVDQVGPFFKGQAAVNLFFHTDQGIEGVGDVISRQGHSGKVWGVGYNVSLPILDSIDKGDVLLTMNQGFDNHADAATQGCIDFLVAGKVNPPLAYVTAEAVTKDGGEGLVSAAVARDTFKKATGE